MTDRRGPRLSESNRVEAFSDGVFAIAITLLIASAPYDMALTASIWNPPLSVAFLKIAVACVLLSDGKPSIWWAAAATAAAVLAVQSHSSAVFLSVPVVASLLLRT